MKNLNKWVIVGTFAIYALGAIFHFGYDVLGNNFITRFLFPVNESVFEHVKIVLYPSLIYFISSYFYFKKKEIIGYEKILFSYIFFYLLTIILMVGVFYVSKYSFRIESDFIQIAGLFVYEFLGMIFAKHYITYGKKHSILWFCIFSTVLIVSTTILSAFTPELPIFISKR